MNRKTLPIPPCLGRGLVTAILLASFAIGGYAQDDNDFGLDFTAGAEKKITNWLSFGIDANFSTQNNLKDIDKYDIGGAFDFKIINTKKFDLKASLGWEYMWQKVLDSESTLHYDTETKYIPGKGMTDVSYVDGCNVTSDFWRNRHRTTLAFTGVYSPNKRWDISLRESVQYNHYCNATQPRIKYRNDDLDGDESIEDIINDSETTVKEDDKEIDNKDRFVLRSKLTVQYNIKRSIFSPYASVDYGCGLNYSTNKWKVTAGTDIDLSKQHKLDVFYRFQTEDDDEEPNGHIIGIGYKFKF